MPGRIRQRRRKMVRRKMKRRSEEAERKSMIK